MQVKREKRKKKIDIIRNKTAYYRFALALISFIIIITIIIICRKKEKE